MSLRRGLDSTVRGCGVVFLWLAASTSAAAERYVFDPSHCVPSFQFDHFGLTRQEGRFDRISGEVSLDRDQRSGRIRYVIESASLDMGHGTESPDSPGFKLFEVATYPTIVFESRHLVFNKAGEIVGADGTLTLLGVTRPLAVRMSGFHCGTNPLDQRPLCSGNVEATLKRSEFGMTTYIPAISDEIRIRVPVEAYRAAERPAR